MSFHSLVSLGARHPIHNYEYANAAARTGASGFVATDIGKVARQLDDDSYWVLTQTTPTWVQINAAGGAPLASTAPANVTKAAAVIGVGTTAARADHKHDIATAAPGAVGVATASGEGSSTSLARADHTHQANTAPVNVTKAAAAIGTSGQPARADHKHDIATAAPSTIGTANTEGSSTSLARADHVHNHGDLAGGALHAAATPSVAGFLSAADKTKLNGLFTEQFYAETEGTLTTASGTPVSCQVLNFTATGGTYLVEWYLEARNQTNNSTTRVICEINGTDAGFADLDSGSNAVNEMPWSGMRQVVLAAGSNTVELFFNEETGGDAQVRRRRIKVRRVA